MEQVFNLLRTSLPLLLQGFYTTMTLWISASIVSCTIGIVVGIFRSNALRVPYVSSVLDGITFVFRAVPFYVQLLIVYFVIPHILTLHISAFSAALVSLGLCSASYVSQIVRGGINAIAYGQWEAAKALGCTTFQTLWYVVMPQAMPIILPALVGECDQLLKSTAIVSTIGVLELTGAGRNIIAQEMNPLTIYTVLAVIYLLISALLAMVAVWIEKRLSHLS